MHLLCILLDDKKSYIPRVLGETILIIKEKEIIWPIILLKTRRENCESRGCIFPERGHIGGGIVTEFVNSGCFRDGREMAKLALLNGNG